MLKASLAQGLALQKFEKFFDVLASEAPFPPFVWFAFGWLVGFEGWVLTLLFVLPRQLASSQRRCTLVEAVACTGKSDKDCLSTIGLYGVGVLCDDGRVPKVPLTSFVRGLKKFIQGHKTLSSLPTPLPPLALACLMKAHREMLKALAAQVYKEKVLEVCECLAAVIFYDCARQPELANRINHLKVGNLLQFVAVANIMWKTPKSKSSQRQLEKANVKTLSWNKYIALQNTP